jgi:crossover junction endodeoxyribonuclease RusA
MKHQTAPSGQIEFSIPMVPPGVNHYVKHTRNGKHYKTSEAIAWEETFALHAPKLSVQGKTFYLHVAYVLGKGQRLDIDNGNKCALDAVARAGMLRDRDGKVLSDAWIERLYVGLDRKTRPQQGRTSFIVGVLQ